VKTAVRDAVSELHRYPSAANLTRAIAIAAGVPEEWVVTTNGADELCHLIAALFIEPEGAVVLSRPGYRIGEIASAIRGAKLREVPLIDGQHDLENMLAAARGASLVWLPNPHNPTGRSVDPEAVEWFLGELDERCVLVMDEAYREFADETERPDAIRLVREYPNLILQRTLSKAYALAGLRVGYGIASPALIQVLRLARPPFTNNVCAIAAATAALGDRTWSEYLVSRVRLERQRLEGFLASIGREFWPSQANFVTVRFEEQTAEAERALAGVGVSVRNGRELGVEGWLRISIGTSPQMARVREALAGVS
jgi:histidinol-phosphate aminotransferase